MEHAFVQRMMVVVGILLIVTIIFLGDITISAESPRSAAQEVNITP